MKSIQLRFYCIEEGILLKNRFRALWKEAFRKSIHLCSAFVPLVLHFNKALTIWLLGAAIVLYTVFEILRLKGISIPFVSAITEAAARKRDENKFVLGPVTLAVGILLAVIFFDEPAVTVGILALAFGDGLASLSGKLFGGVYIPFTGGKTVLGSLTCFTAILISTFFVLGSIEAALVIASAGMLIEVLPLKDLDNVLIPVALAFVTNLI